MKKTISVLLLLTMLVSLFAGLTLTAEAAQPTSASAVQYRTSSGYVYNWGKRDTTATFLTTYAQNYYTGQYSYATLSALSGSSASGTGFYSSQLGTAIHNMLEAKQKSTTSYNGTKDLYKYTDCEENGDKISSYYSGAAIGPNWGSSPTWNREHTWPNSKGLDGSDENDIMMLRPTAESENGDRSNTAYGESGSYYDPNQNGQQLHGDVARLMLQHLMRWGNTSKFYGTGGVMESREVLLKWMIEDPVDTWEMGRNDAVQAITGVRNVFVDYPELAFKLLGATMPADYQTPSGGGAPAYTITATSNNNNYGTVTLNGSTITASPTTGYYAKDYSVTSGTASVTQNGNFFTVVPTSDCTVRINFAAKTSVTVTLNNNGSTSTKTGHAGEAMTLTMPTAPTGYTAVGWVSTSVSDSTTKPATVYTTSYTPTASCTLYALFSHVVGGGGGSGDYEKVTATSGITDGQYLIVYETGSVALDSSLATIDAVEDTIDVTISNNTIPSNSTTDAAAFTFTASNGAFLGTNGKYIGHTGTSNTLNTSTTAMSNTVTIDGSGNAVIDAGSSYVLRFNAASDQMRFRYYKGTQQTIQLYKKGAGGTIYYTTSTGPACSHTYTSVVTQPTCTAGGYTTYTCSKCGDTYTGNNTAALGHNYGSFSSNNNGTHSKTCSRCSDKVTESCSYTSSVSGATTTFTCSVCHYSYQTTAQTFTVRYNVLGTVSSTASCVEGQNVNLPATATTVDGFTFAGWVKSTVTPETTTAPTILTGSYKPTANITLYALYSRTEAGGSTTPTLTKMVAGNTIADGDKLVIVAHDTTIALYRETTSSSYVNKYTFTSNVNTILADSKNYVTAVSATGGFKLGLRSSDNKLYADDTATQVWTLSDLGDGTFKLQSDGRNLSYRSDIATKYWRMGGANNGTSGQTVLDLYKVTSGASSTTYYTTSPSGSTPHVHDYDSAGICSCGDKLISIDSAALKLDEDIDVIYNVTVPEGTVATMTFTMNGETTTVSGDGSEGFIFEGVTPQCMGDNISATLTVTYGGKSYACTKANYSVKTYCTDMLSKSSTTTQLRKLLSDTLAYGAAAQTYMGYNTSSLVTSGVTGTSYSTFTALSGLAPAFTGTAADSPCWIGAGLTLTDDVAMVFRFASPNKTGLSVKVTLNGVTKTFSGTSITAVSGMSGVYEVKLSGIKATDFGQTVTAKFYKSSAQIGNTLGYSVNTYVCAKQNDSNTALKNLVRALYNYGASAAAYAG